MNGRVGKRIEKVRNGLENVGKWTGMVGKWTEMYGKLAIYLCVTPCKL